MPSKVWNVMNDLEMVTSKICSAREIIDVAVEAIQKHDYNKAETLAVAAHEFLDYYLSEFDEKFKLAWKETVVKGKEEDPCMPPWGHSDLEYASKHKEPLACDKDNNSPECQKSWNDFWEETYYPEEYKGSTVSSVQSTGEKSPYYYDYTRNDPNRPNPFNQQITKTLNYSEAIAAGWTMTDDGFWIPPETKKKWVLPVQETKIEETDETEYFITFPDDLLEAANLKEGDDVYWVDNGDGTWTIRKVTEQLKMDEC